MTTRDRIFVLLACFSVMVDANAQDKPHLHLIARAAKDSVVLRWAPGSAASWERLNTYGYKIERVTIRTGMHGRPAVETLTRDTLRPWPLEKWKQRFPEDHPYAPVAAQALYGKTFGPPADPHDLISVSKASQVLTMRWTFSLMMAEFNGPTATALGLRWVDRDLSPDARYLYRVISLDPSFPDTAITSVNRANGPDPLPDTPPPTAKELERSVSLSWETLPARPPFTAYWIERSPDGKAWVRMTKMPVMKGRTGQADDDLAVTWTDTAIVKNYVPYHYRLIGITPFGESGTPSSEVIAMGRDRTPPPDPQLKGVKDEHGKLVVHWEMSDVPRDLKGFRVDKAPDIKGPFLPLHASLLPATARSFTDTSRDLLGENHYVVIAIDTAGNESRSLPGYGFLVDSIAPAIPATPVGSVDTSGVVRLHWKRGPERDIMGYRVFFANSPDHEFSNRTGVPVADTAFTDTIQLNTLTKRIYYRIVAVDRNYNHSVFSKILVLQKPDKVKPVPPVFSNYRVSDTTVVLSFVPSTSEDVAEHRLLRTKQGSSEWKEIARWPSSDKRTSFTDMDVEGPAFYSYVMQAVDSAGNASQRCAAVDVRVYQHLKNAVVTDLRAVYNKQARRMELSWSRPTSPVKFYVIYRSRNGAPPSTVCSVDGTAQNFNDLQANATGRYEYQLKAVYVNGAVSPMANGADAVDVK